MSSLHNCTWLDEEERREGVQCVARSAGIRVFVRDVCGGGRRARRRRGAATMDGFQSAKEGEKREREREKVEEPADGNTG